MSGGEQQRVAIARAVIARPQMLIADEPTGNVDPDMALKLLRLFEALNNRVGTTVIVATHDVHLLKKVPGFADYAAAQGAPCRTRQARIALSPAPRCSPNIGAPHERPSRCPKSAMMQAMAR